MMKKQVMDKITDEVRQEMNLAGRALIERISLEEAIAKTMVKTMMAFSPPSKCDKCGGKLSKWVGSLTCIRIEYVTGEIKWHCTDCYALYGTEQLYPNNHVLNLDNEQYTRDIDALRSLLTPEQVMKKALEMIAGTRGSPWCENVAREALIKVEEMSKNGEQNSD